MEEPVTGSTSVEYSQAARVLPTVGRVVHYHPYPNEFGLAANSSSPVPAIITAVWSDSCVNLKIIVDGPFDVWKTSVGLPYDPALLAGSWSWPPRS